MTGVQTCALPICFPVTIERRIDGGQVIIAKFNVDEELVNIYADLSLNSLDEFRNEYIL